MHIHPHTRKNTYICHSHYNIHRMQYVFSTCLYKYQAVLGMSYRAPLAALVAADAFRPFFLVCRYTNERERAKARARARARVRARTRVRARESESERESDGKSERASMCTKRNCKYSQTCYYTYLSIASARALYLFEHCERESERKRKRVNANVRARGKQEREREREQQSEYV